MTKFSGKKPNNMGMWIMARNCYTSHKVVSFLWFWNNVIQDGYLEYGDMIATAWSMGVFGRTRGKSTFLCNYFDDFNWNNNHFLWYNISATVHIKNNGTRSLFRPSMSRALMTMTKFNDVTANAFMSFIPEGLIAYSVNAVL